MLVSLIFRKVKKIGIGRAIGKVKGRDQEQNGRQMKVYIPELCIPNQTRPGRRRKLSDVRDQTSKSRQNPKLDSLPPQ